MMGEVLDILNRLVSSVLSVAMEAAPWLLFGLLFAGVIRAMLPEKAVAKWLGSGKMGVLRAAVIGTPLPLCSCGVVPAAFGLRRAGASKPATVSFLVSTPENGADSIALSYALLGPVMAVARVVAALVCAIGAGMLALYFDTRDLAGPGREPGGESEHACCCTNKAETPSCCSTGDVSLTMAEESCCSNASDDHPRAPARASGGAPPGVVDRLGEGVHYAMSKLLDDLAPWLVIGLVVSGALLAFVPPGALAEWGSGPLAMVVMAVVGVPMYVCATAATPVAAGLIAAGVSPGAALVLLLAGPATNLGTVGIVRKELGTGALVAYLVGVVGLAILSGLGLEALLDATGWSVDVSGEGGHTMLIPGQVSAGALAVLLAFGIRPLRRALLRFAD